MSADGEYVLALEFDTDEPEFARGFEAGRIWQRLQSDPEPQQHMVWVTNVEMFIRMGEALGRTVQGNEVTEDVIGDDWWTVDFGSAPPFVPEANDWDYLA